MHMGPGSLTEKKLVPSAAAGCGRQLSWLFSAGYRALLPNCRVLAQATGMKEHAGEVTC